MKISKHIYLAAGFLLLLLSAFIAAETFLAPHAFMANLQHLAPSYTIPVDLSRIASLYHFDARIPRIKITRAATYLPQYQPLTLADADTYANDFGAIGAPSETENAYIYACISGTLTIDKLTHQIRYDAAPVDIPFATDATQNVLRKAGSLGAAETAAEAALARFHLTLSYGRIVTTRVGSIYAVCFVPKIGDMDNWGFPTTVMLHPNGQLLSIETYPSAYHKAAGYDKLATCNFKSLHAAQADLPIDYPAGTSIRIYAVSPVYHLANSILQPAYLFEGTFETGEPFHCFVPAATFGSGR